MANIYHKLMQVYGERSQWRAEPQIERTVVMDFEMSVAASVVFYLLLTSGDVELNPGPGGTYSRNYDGPGVMLFSFRY